MEVCKYKECCKGYRKDSPTCQFASQYRETYCSKYSNIESNGTASHFYKPEVKLSWLERMFK
jgi:hypothetical protein